MLSSALSTSPSKPVVHEFPNLDQKKILIIEDEPTIALTYAFKLNQLGARVEAVRATNRGAMAYLATHEVDAAIVDYWLADGAGNPVIMT
jgi:DNA-binding response OmpR family regulator